MSAQGSGSAEVPTTNYLPVLTEDTDWRTISDETRAGIARYAVNTALGMAKSENISNYNILGTTANGDAAFLYVPKGEIIQIIVDVGNQDEIPLRE
jgi:hypothetical protein